MRSSRDRRRRPFRVGVHVTPSSTTPRLLTVPSDHRITALDQVVGRSRRCSVCCSRSFPWSCRAGSRPSPTSTRPGRAVLVSLDTPADAGAAATPTAGSSWAAVTVPASEQQPDGSLPDRLTRAIFDFVHDLAIGRATGPDPDGGRGARAGRRRDAGGLGDGRSRPVHRYVVAARDHRHRDAGRSRRRRPVHHQGGDGRAGPGHRSDDHARRRPAGPTTTSTRNRSPSRRPPPRRRNRSPSRRPPRPSPGRRTRRRPRRRRRPTRNRRPRPPPTRSRPPRRRVRTRPSIRRRTR